MKTYSIKEFSELSGISKEMIRYYEKFGVISPVRNSDNNYREYTVFDYFSLLEVISMTRFNVNIKDVFRLRNNDDYGGIESVYMKYIEETRRNIELEQIMIRRADELMSRMRLGELNRTHFWVRKEKQYSLLKLMKSRNDEYELMNYTEQIRQWMQDGSHIALSDSFVRFDEEHQTWFRGVAEEYMSAASFPKDIKAEVIPASYCLCAIADMGEIGSFNIHDILPVIERMKKEPYRFTGEYRAKLLGREWNSSGIVRLIELQMPIEL